LLPPKQSLPAEYSLSPEELERARETLILSASGWRKVFALDGEEESLSPEVGRADQVLACVMAGVFGNFLTQNRTAPNPRLALGIDSRPTGPLLAQLMIRTLLSQGIEVDYLGIVAAPQIMAWVQASPRHHGFVYISASHNPAGHNGVKFGFEEGSVIGGALALSLISAFRQASSTPETALEYLKKADSVPIDRLQKTLDAQPSAQKASQTAYLALSRRILSPGSRTALRRSVRHTNVGIVAEFNGSARSTSIDEKFLKSLGVSVQALNAVPGKFVHRILPEGESLTDCRIHLEKLHQHDKRWRLGYVPDCDGDRGNVVWFDEKTSQAQILSAQEVFALCVLSELAGLVYDGVLTYDENAHPQQRVAVVCNDPTSLRIDRIAKVFGASVFRAEVGEANVVGLARKLRNEGWIVRILGEGSNGGNITHPGAVRDPLSTVGSLLKLVWLRDQRRKPGIFSIWCQKSGLEAPGKDFGFAEVLATLPAFQTTPTSEPRAVLKIRTLRHDHLKAAYERRFLTKEWKEKSDWLRERFGIWSWEEINYEGLEERRGFGPPFRSGKETGGFKIQWKNKEGEAVGYSWMRGSGTEPLFRVLVDIEGNDPSAEAELLAWHTRIIAAVD
jgi:phosphoglucomutase